MKLIFGARPAPGSWLIRLFTFSRWSHVGIVYGDEVVEAALLRVRTISLADFKRHYPHWATADLYCADESAAEHYTRSRIGNLYDIGGLLAFPFMRREWQSNNRDFCSELPVCAAAAGGTAYVRDEHRITPEMLWEMSK